MSVIQCTPILCTPLFISESVKCCSKHQSLHSAWWYVQTKLDINTSQQVMMNFFTLPRLLIHLAQPMFFNHQAFCTLSIQEDPGHLCLSWKWKIGLLCQNWLLTSHLGVTSIECRNKKAERLNVLFTYLAGERKLQKQVWVCVVAHTFWGRIRKKLLGHFLSSPLNNWWDISS